MKKGEYRRKVVRSGSGRSASVTIPVDLIRELNWQRGQFVTVRRRGNKLIIKDWEK